MMMITSVLRALGSALLLSRRLSRSPGVSLSIVMFSKVWPASFFVLASAYNNK